MIYRSKNISTGLWASCFICGLAIGVIGGVVHLAVHQKKSQALVVSQSLMQAVAEYN